MQPLEDVERKRRALLIIGCFFTLLPPLITFLTEGFPFYVYGGALGLALFGSGVAGLARIVLPVALIVGYLKWPQRLGGAYWLIPLHFVTLGVVVLLSHAVRWTAELRTGASDSDVLLRDAAFLGLTPLFIAFMVWYYRPRPNIESFQP